MTALLDEISEALIFEPLSLVDSIFEHRFYSFEELLQDSPHILQILYLFPHGNTVAAAAAAVQKDEHAGPRTRRGVEHSLSHEGYKNLQVSRQILEHPIPNLRQAQKDPAYLA